MGAAHSGRSELKVALLEALRARANAADVCIVHDMPAKDDFLRQGFDAVLLMGLDLPSARQGAVQDQAWRSMLHQAQVPFHVIYGLGPRRLASAFAAVTTSKNRKPGMHWPLPDETHSGEADPDGPQNPPRWRWRCEKCSDADCEHRLFAALKGERQAGQAN